MRASDITPLVWGHDNPALLLQDCDRKLAQWFASRLNAQAVVRRQWPEIVATYRNV